MGWTEFCTNTHQPNIVRLQLWEHSRHYHSIASAELTPKSPENMNNNRLHPSYTKHISIRYPFATTSNASELTKRNKQLLQNPAYISSYFCVALFAICDFK